MNSNENNKMAIQSAKEYTNEMIKRKIRNNDNNSTVSLNAIFVFFFSSSVNSLLFVNFYDLRALN